MRIKYSCLVHTIAEKCGMDAEDVLRVLNTTSEYIVHNVSEGNSVYMKNMGSFYLVRKQMSAGGIKTDKKQAYWIAIKCSSATLRQKLRERVENGSGITETEAAE